MENDLIKGWNAGTPELREEKLGGEESNLVLVRDAESGKGGGFTVR